MFVKRYQFRRIITIGFNGIDELVLWKLSGEKSHARHVRPRKSWHSTAEVSPQEELAWSIRQDLFSMAFPFLMFKQILVLRGKHSAVPSLQTDGFPPIASEFMLRLPPSINNAQDNPRAEDRITPGCGRVTVMHKHPINAMNGDALFQRLVVDPVDWVPTHLFLFTGNAPIGAGSLGSSFFASTSVR